LRRLPPREALWPREGEDDDHGDGHDYRYAAYITGLAVAKSARRRGVASTLVDYAERKGAAWGAAGLCLHVNRLNTPALRLYDRLGFSVVPDWYGYNNQRFLLFKPLNGEAPETPPPAAPPRNALSPLQKEILVDGGTEPPGASARPGGLDFDLEEAYGTKFPTEGAYRCVRCSAKVYWARTKMGCGCGWPAFYDCVDGAVDERPEYNDPLSSAPPKYGVEAVCKACGGHLGHVIRGEGLGTPTDARHCINGAVLKYDASAEGQPADVEQMPNELLGE
jgi:peptide-methionine (R)-S-oxide reductase